MAKRGYKLQEFVAHSTNVNCLSIGKKACRLFITGGDDHKVNLWAIGKPSSLMSLCGHASPVESVAFDAAEVLVLAGASTGAIKMWDLEEAKMVRTLTGHRANSTAVEFHPFGEFFASGSTDTNLRIWDIRKKGCIHTYKGHTQGISTIKFTPDGRWVVSGGYDNVVKVWDLTAGKLLHDFKFHEGHIRSIDFHPLEFLLTTGSADKTVKFWDLETFELIGSTRAEAAGVRSITFHPDGRTLFCGLDDSLKVYSWEPVICHDAADMGWSTLCDLCIHEGKLLGCSYYRNSVGVWVANIELIQPYGAGFISEEIDCREQNFSSSRIQSPDKIDNFAQTTEALHSRSPECKILEIKNICVDSIGGNPVTSQRVAPLSSSQVVPALVLKERSTPPTQRHSPVVGLNAKASRQALNKSFTAPAVVLRETPLEEDLPNSGRENIPFSRTKPGMLLRPAHVRRPSNSKNDVEKLSESGMFNNMAHMKDCTIDERLQNPIVPKGGAQKYSEEMSSNIKNVAEQIEKNFSPDVMSMQENCDKSVDDSKGIGSVKIVSGVAVVAGRIRTLVEKFERREKLNNEHQVTQWSSQAVVDTSRTPIVATDVNPQSSFQTDGKASMTSDKAPQVIPENDRTCNTAPSTIPATNSNASSVSNKTSHIIPKTDVMPVVPTSGFVHETNWKHSSTSSMISHILPERDRTSTAPATVTHVTCETGSWHPILEEDPQISGHEPTSASGRNISEDLMQTHDIFLSALKSRLTKLQVVRHFWERNDMEGAINAMRKLPDHSVQADVISVLMEKMEIVSLYLFSCLLPVLVGLLESKLERNAKISLEMLLKLVAVFGPVIRSAVTAPPAVGVDLHAEKRLECCKQCFMQLQKIQEILPSLIRRGGLLAKCANELILVLQES
ncbi:hypothetical protein K2173_004345 [Erythroxylum novogranatense]|uniref:Katanin p80 WD40 repeat-containing subunit B1 homolog n=1 Tax=Erythroxylum novogranatense TaxID=1862640 RepID=A0AAV8T5D4_9ROSI|nr:hypothetical protein K2173_004345 [Erythroxylum novogranatense]